MNGIYMSVVGVALVLLAALISAFLAWRVSKAFTATAAYRAGIAFVVVIGVVIAMTWDVVRTSLTMAELCPQAGVFVNKSVRVDGFYTNSGFPDTLKEGFQYIESEEVGGRIIVYSKESGANKKEEFDAKTYQLRSRYEVKYDVGEKPYQGRRDIGVQKSFVRDRLANEELAYALRYYAYPGWVDRHTLSLLTQVLWACPTVLRSHAIEMRKQALLPLKKGE